MNTVHHPLELLEYLSTGPFKSLFDRLNCLNRVNDNIYDNKYYHVAHKLACYELGLGITSIKIIKIIKGKLSLVY